MIIFLAAGLEQALGSADFAILPVRTANDSEYLIDAWETEQGLPENSATAMVQTPDGYLWFGTFNGLVRFDGLTFTRFDPSNTPELPSTGIVNLHLDASRRLWVSTLAGLVVSEPGRWTAFHPVKEWSGPYVRRFCENAGVLCLTSSDGKVFRVQAGKMERLPDPPGLKTGFLAYVDRTGRIWVSQSRTAFFGCWDGRQWNRSPMAEEFYPGFVSLTGLRDGRLLVVKHTELLYIEEDRIVSRVPLASGQSISTNWFTMNLNQDHLGNVWICTKGLYRVSPSGALRYFCSTNGLTYDSLRFTFEDREQNLWVGTSGGGLMRFKPRTFVAYREPSGLTERNVKAVLEEAPGKVLIGAYGGGLFRWDGERISRLEEQRQPVASWVQCLLRDRDQNLWVGSFSGEPAGIPLTLLTPTGRREVTAAECGGPTIRALYQDSQGRVWIGGGETVSVFANGHFTLQHSTNGACLGEVRCFAEDPRQGDLWAGGRNGLAQFAGGEWRAVSRAADQALRGVCCMRCESDGSLWIGGVGAGLLRLKNGHWSSVGASEGLAVSQVACILEDGLGYWWLGSNEGVIRAARADLARVADGAASNLVCRVFGLADGLASVECASGMQSCAARDSQGRLWFATLKGVAMVDPRGIPAHLNTNPPPVQVETVSCLDGRQKRTQLWDSTGNPGANPEALRLQLPPGSSHFEARFAALSFAAPERVKLRYHLTRNRRPFLSEEGSSRTLNLRELPPGDYQLRVTAANNDGVWNHQGVSLAFAVQPWYWQTLWFRALGLGLAGAAIALSVSLVLRSRLRRTEEQLRQQQTLAEERARAAALTQYASDLITLLDPRGRVIYESPSATRILGYPEGHFLGKHPAEFIHPEDQTVAQEALQHLADGVVRGVPATLRFRHALGHWKYLESVGANLLDRPGVQGILITSRDVDERKRAEERIRQQAALLEASHDAILVWDVVKGVQFMNPAAEQLTGRTSEQARSQDLGAVLHPRSDLALRAALEEVTAHGRWTGELVLLTGNDKPRILASRWTVLADDHGKPTSVLITCNDITEQKRLEDQYLRAQRLESVGTLASGVAHDLNNILSPIIMGVEMLETKATDQDTRTLLAMIQQSAHRGRDTVKQLLTFARGTESQKGPVQPWHLLKEIARLLQQTFPKNIQIHTDCLRRPATVLADPSQLHQVLMNLCVNARDAMPDGGVLFLTLENRALDAASANLHPKARPIPYVVFKVSDSGTGIPPEAMDRIFDPFFSTKPQGKGTGLGLATVLGIVEGHGGFVLVESKPGQGTTFQVFLPASAPSDTENIRKEAVESPRGQGQLVLVVDDEPAIVHIAEGVLRHGGYQTLAAKSASEALILFEKNRDRIRAILTDIMMPFGDGRQLIATLRERDPRLPIIAMSGLATGDFKRETLKRGARTFVSKPFTPDQLLTALRDVLRDATR